MPPIFNFAQPQGAISTPLTNYTVEASAWKLKEAKEFVPQGRVIKTAE